MSLRNGHSASRVTFIVGNDPVAENLRPVGVQFVIMTELDFLSCDAGTECRLARTFRRCP
jgi:hypothetical protein